MNIEEIAEAIKSLTVPEYESNAAACTVLDALIFMLPKGGTRSSIVDVRDGIYDDIEAVAEADALEQEEDARRPKVNVHTTPVSTVPQFLLRSL